VAPDPAAIASATPPLGRRIKTDVDADGSGGGAASVAWHVYDGQNPYADFDSGGTLTMRYVHGAEFDELYARTDSGGGSAWYLRDRLGTVRDVVDTSGTSLYHASYEAFGTIVSTTGTADRWAFTGRELNSESEDYFYRARLYNPRAGRFTGRDPFGLRSGDTNAFRYVSNSSTMWTDPLGLQQSGGVRPPYRDGGYPTTGASVPQLPPVPNGPWDLDTAVEYMKLTKSGKDIWERVEKDGGKVQVFVARSITVTEYYSIFPVYSYPLFGYTTRDKSKVYVSIDQNKSIYEATGTLFHELTHAYGANEAEARRREAEFYAELANVVQDSRVIYDDYLKRGIIKYDKEKGYYVDDANLKKFVDSLNKQKEKYPGATPVYVPEDPRRYYPR
jgi:RHS repeat-associated protein